MLRPLIIDEEVKARIAEVVAFAEKNFYYIDKSETVPGDDPRHTVYLLSYRCVFSLTVDPKENLFRHLSISVPGKNFPNPFAFFTIAELFGFTGWDGASLKPPADWYIDVNKRDRCIVAVQPVNQSSSEEKSP